MLSHGAWDTAGARGEEGLLLVGAGERFALLRRSKHRAGDFLVGEFPSPSKRET